MWIKFKKNKKMFVKTIGFLKNSVIIYKVTHSSIRWMSKFGEENNLVVQATSYMYPPIRKDESSVGVNNRFTAKEAADNYIKIKQYILTRDDHFFNSLVLAVYDGLPVWTEIRYELEEEWYHNVGMYGYRRWRGYEM